MKPPQINCRSCMCNGKTKRIRRGTFSLLVCRRCGLLARKERP